MYLDESGVQRLFLRVPYMRLAKQQSARRFVEALVRDGTELESMLRQYPAVRYQPLDHHYVLLMYLGGLTEELLDELCCHYLWPGVVWAAWLAALAPDARYRQHLAAARARVPHNQWLVDLALFEIDARVWGADVEFQQLVQQLRSLLAGIARPTVVFRPRPADSEVEQLDAKRAAVLRAYRSGGLEAALEVLHGL